MSEPGKAWRNKPEAEPEAEPADDWHAGHKRYLDVDANDELYKSCHHPSGALCGQAALLGKVTPKRAEAVRRAAAAHRNKR